MKYHSLQRPCVCDNAISKFAAMVANNQGGAMFSPGRASRTGYFACVDLVFSLPLYLVSLSSSFSLPALYFPFDHLRRAGHKFEPPPPLVAHTQCTQHTANRGKVSDMKT